VRQTTAAVKVAWDLSPRQENVTDAATGNQLTVNVYLDEESTTVVVVAAVASRCTESDGDTVPATVGQPERSVVSERSENFDVWSTTTCVQHSQPQLITPSAHLYIQQSADIHTPTANMLDLYYDIQYADKTIHV